MLSLSAQESLRVIDTCLDCSLFRSKRHRSIYSTMAETSTSAAAQEIEINVRPPGGGDKKIPIKVDTSKTVIELKQDIAKATEIPAENQRLIYSGRVLKDEEQVSTYKIRWVIIPCCRQIGFTTSLTWRLRVAELTISQPTLE